MNAFPIEDLGTPLAAWKHSSRLARLPVITPQRLVPTYARAVIVAPHPDDEVLGCGGLMQLLSQAGRPLQLISVTDGSASHPGSSRWSAARLSVIRPQESAAALRRLGLCMTRLKWIRGGFPDSQVSRRESSLAAFVQRYLRPGDVVFTTWRQDGHPDHEAVGRAVATAAARVGAVVHELPIWAWNWLTPEDREFPWNRACKVQLDIWSQARKRHAVQAFVSQLAGDREAGLAPILAPHVLERLLQPFELVLL
ncbi:MAG: PIG-L family deacetylase [Pseudomonas sp.]|uniref:PIG-L deacetylase family protein n=1 Tax=Pseudomonas sp. TaxID=306 RepID=UPI00339A7F5C